MIRDPDGQLIELLPDSWLAALPPRPIVASCYHYARSGTVRLWRSTTNVVKRETSLLDTYRRRGYFFREVAMLTIVMGFGLHLYRVIFGDDLTLQYVVTPTTDILLMIPMTYAAITGILSYRRMRFANRLHKAALTAALAYITVSVPLHIYVLLVLGDVSFYVHMAGYWFSYLLLIVVYPAFLTLFARLQYRN